MYSKEEVIFFSSVMGWIFLTFLFPNKCRSCSPVMAISNICIWNFFSEQYFNQFVCFLIFNYPEMMSKTILSNKIIFGFFCADYLIYNLINNFNGRICKKYWFNICIINAYVNHTILFFIRTCKFMLFNNPIKIVVDRRTPDYSILGSSFHCLGINIKTWFFILNQPAVFLPFSKIIN